MPNSIAYTTGEGGLSSPILVVMVVTIGNPRLVWLILRLHRGDFYTLGSWLDG